MTVSNSATESSERRGGTYLLIAICFLLSGFAALLYETVWLRQFAIILGTSEQALAVILASYMGGLAAGSWLVSKCVDQITRPVLLYGVLEAGIAACAIAMPWGLGLVEHLQIQWFGGASEPPAAGSLSQIVFGLTSSFALILPPTAMMGATLPLLAKQVVHRDRHVGPRIGILYGINTFGAVAGTLTAAFLLLPALGLARTTWVGAATNLGIFALVYLVARNSAVPLSSNEDPVPEPPGDKEHESEVASLRYPLVLWFAAAAGAVAFCYEIIFTRMLGHVLGGSVYAFATMLAGFLLGIALGGTLASRVAIRRDGSVVALIYTQSLAGVSALFAYHLIDRVAGWTFGEWGGSSATLTQVLISILILLPTATFIGATFPLATRIFARDQSEAATSSAKVYFFNVLGGIAGALMMGIFLLPSQGYQGAAITAILLNACLVFGLAWVMRARPVHCVVAVTVIVLLVCLPPVMPERVMRASVLNPDATKGELIFSRVGRSGTVALFDQQGDIRFMTNGLPEAIVAQRGIEFSPIAASEAWLSAIPPLLRPDCDSMLIIGLGGGVAAAYVPPSVNEIDVFELEPAVVEANRFIRDRRNRDPLADERLRVILNDGRNGLALTSKKYDAIVSQPSHPWTAGASHLYTREFAEMAAKRLKGGGIFLQWMNTRYVNPDLFRSLAATLLDVFPHVRVYEPTPGNALFVASDQMIRPEATTQPKLAIDSRNRQHYSKFGLHTSTHLFSLLRIDEPELRELADGWPLITDEYNLLAMRAPRLIVDPDTEGMQRFLKDYSAYRQSATKIRDDCPTLNVIDYGLRLADREIRLEPDLVRELVADDADRLLYQAKLARKDGQLDRWEQLLREMTSLHRDDPRPAFLLLAHSTLGTYQSLEPSEAEDFESRLDGRYADLLEAIEAIRRNDLTAVQQSDVMLASFGVDEIGYEMAVRLRLMWRIADQGADRLEHGREALFLVGEATPVLGPNAMVTFRVVAALQADRQEVALASVVDYAESVVEQIKQKKITDVSELKAMRNNLLRCRDIIQDRNLFPSIPTRRYDAALNYLQKVIDGDV